MRPYRVDIPQADLDDLHRRLAGTRWPEGLPGEGWERGVPMDYLRELAEYWRTEFDWRAAERRINAYDQFVTEIDGVEVHFLHARSAEKDAVPLILTHGWPGAFTEFLGVLDALTDPVRHGGPASDAFHVVVPSLPGYGFSSAPTEPGWDTERVARAWAELMARLGYDRYFVQGGDWGSPISLRLGLADPEHVAGVHVNMLVTVPPPDDPAAVAALDEHDQARLRSAMGFEQDGTGWRKIQSTRPVTLSYALTDSPVGQLAWITEKVKEWSDSADVPEDAVRRDDLLTIASIYWFTGSAGSSAQLYYESSHSMEKFLRTWIGPWPLTMPVGVVQAAGDVVHPVRRFAEGILPTLSHWREYDHGGHFLALEQPRLFVGDVREFFRTVRSPVPAGAR
jgi:pimeloyl-ACP methyl ester carboxylesterase